MRRFFRRLKIYKKWLLLFFSLLILSFFFWRIFWPLIIFVRTNSLSSSFFFNFLFAKELPLKKFQGQTNLLILGIAGKEYKGGDLTDTILFLSFNQEKKRLSIISLPRDIWSETLKDKINSAYHYGEEKKRGGGLILAKATAEEVLDQPVHYAFVFDFSAFEEIINLLGGVEIEVERSFVDYKFPLPGKENDSCAGDPEYRCRFENIKFEKGWQKMDGATVLKFIRSRNAEGEEGTDFARIRRQQKVLEAIKDKVFSFKILRQPQVLIALLATLQEKSQSDANLGETLYLSKLFFIVKDKRTISLEEQLINPPFWEYGGRWVLLPKEDWQNFHEFIAKELKEKYSPSL